MNLGIIAGNRQYPIIFAEEAKRQGVSLFAVAFRGETDSSLKRLVDDIHWIHVGQLDEMIRYFKSKEINSAVMVGQISPWRLFKRLNLDERAKKVLSGVKQMSAETIFSAIADELKKEGIELKDARLFLDKYLATKGHISSISLSGIEKQDVDFGVNIIKGVSSFNIGQTIIIKNKTVVAVEAMEGTDNAILRGGRIGRGNVVVVKVSKPNQDMRFDIPVVGPKTVKILKKSGGGVLALETGKVLILEKEKTIKLAEKYGIKIVGV